MELGDILIDAKTAKTAKIPRTTKSDLNQHFEAPKKKNPAEF
jgi:hypothetical protein